MPVIYNYHIPCSIYHVARKQTEVYLLQSEKRMRPHSKVVLQKREKEMSLRVSELSCKGTNTGTRAAVCRDPEDHIHLQGSYKPGFLVSRLYAVLKSECEIPLFMWSLGPLIQTALSFCWFLSRFRRRRKRTTGE